MEKNQSKNPSVISINQWVLNCLRRIRRWQTTGLYETFPAWHRILKNNMIKSLVSGRPALKVRALKPEQMQQEYTIPTLSKCSLLQQTHAVASPSHKDYRITAWLAWGLDLASYLLQEGSCERRTWGRTGEICLPACNRLVPCCLRNPYCACTTVERLGTETSHTFINC